MEFMKLLNIYLNHFPKYKFRKSVKENKHQVIISLLGHAKDTRSLNYFINILKEVNYAENYALPARYGRIYTNGTS